jgi:two-component system chemotaxis response regulator CheB
MSSSSPRSSPVPRTVLVVDDSAFMRKLVVEMVESSGEFRVTATARNGVDALKKVRALDPDLVTLDIEMPELDGLDALGAIMREMPRPVIMLSAAASLDGDDPTLRALELGAIEFVRKPSGPISLDLPTIREELLEALRAAASIEQRDIAPLRHRPPLAPSRSAPGGCWSSPHPPAVRARWRRSSPRCRRTSAPPFWSSSTCPPASREAWPSAWIRRAGCA